MQVLGVLVAVAALLVSSAAATELTFDMDPHSTSCFYEMAVSGQDIAIEFQVSSSSHVLYAPMACAAAAAAVLLPLLRYMVLRRCRRKRETDGGEKSEMMLL